MQELKLKNLEKTVKEILKVNPATRGDDDLLYISILEKMKIDIKSSWI